MLLTLALPRASGGRRGQASAAPLLRHRRRDGDRDAQASAASRQQARVRVGGTAPAARLLVNTLAELEGRELLWDSPPASHICRLLQFLRSRPAFRLPGS